MQIQLKKNFVIINHIVIFYKNNGNCGCNESLTYCQYLGIYEVGQYPLGDMCKICEEHLESKTEW